ncbi:hypothetical protein J7T55_014301 [Diaporthe amygdali]|uniref:uncharacterized protein n=1 Tax=Phomopsis amygdali TaxID=1214568 RepID=UPI0022FEA121|nr:uncharacterized protein J7T55_014301 [Diaporthe amygdali]KAJ0117851.1 hypothetical protein J7T55_014301 [Diaporthe amygdali]
MSSYEVNGKYAIVTGAGSGINLAFAEQLLEKGCSVILADLKLRPEAEEVLSQYTNKAAGKPSAVFHKVDLANWAQISSLWNTALQTFPQIDIVCNGAGIYEPPETSFWNPPGISPLAQDREDANPGQYKSFAVNTAAPIRMAQIAIDYWLQNRHIQGNLLWVASLGGYVHNIQAPIYFATKAAIVSFVKSLAVLKKRLGIRNAAVCPGTVHVDANFLPIFFPEYCKNRVRPEDLGLTPAECASVMMRVLTEPEFGDGNIVEAMMIGSKENPKINAREVPMEALYPTTGALGEDNHLVEEEENISLQPLKNRTITISAVTMKFSTSALLFFVPAVFGYWNCELPKGGDLGTCVPNGSDAGQMVNTCGELATDVLLSDPASPTPPWEGQMATSPPTMPQQLSRQRVRSSNHGSRNYGFERDYLELQEAGFDRCITCARCLLTPRGGQFQARFS